MKILKNKGMATLPTVIVIGIMVLAVVVSITSISLNELFISQGQANSATALFYAEAGARDALIKIARNKNYTCSDPSSCYLEFATNGYSNGTDYSQVLVSGDSSTKVIASKGVMKLISRNIQVVVSLDTNGKISNTTWTESTN